MISALIYPKFYARFSIFGLSYSGLFYFWFIIVFVYFGSYSDLTLRCDKTMNNKTGPECSKLSEREINKKMVMVERFSVRRISLRKLRAFGARLLKTLNESVSILEHISTELKVKSSHWVECSWGIKINKV